MDFIKSLPFIVFFRRVLFEKKFSDHKNVNYFRGVFKNFNEAMLSSPASKPKGYDNLESANLYRERLKTIYTTDYPVLFWMQKLQNNIKKVFDFGGHVGIHYYSYSHYLSDHLLSDWTVCDVESVIKEGKRMASENNIDNLKFTSDLSECDGKDLFFASGSWQYLEWDLGKKLKELKNPPKILIINMLPLHPTLETITLQSTGVAFCPYKIRIEKDFIKDLETVGYRVLDRWHNNEKSCNIAFEKDRSVQFYSGFVFHLIS